MGAQFHIVIVTHNSQESIELCIQSILAQSRNDFRVTILDSGSHDKEYLKKYTSTDRLEVLYEANLGFAVGNNIAAKRYINKIPYTLFVNPDVILPTTFLTSLDEYLALNQGKDFGILGPKLLRYDLKNRSTTNEIDSTGIFQRWYGKWYDRGQGEIDLHTYDSPREPANAICGALMICKSDALKKTDVSEGEYFRNSFFMYKEDIELGLRVQAAGYAVIYTSNLIAYHCRGWRSRRNMSVMSRLYSARNELSINKNRGAIKHFYSWLKVLTVKLQYVIQRINPQEEAIN